RPSGTDAGAGEQDIDPGPLLHPALLPLLVDRPLEGLHLAADAESALQLRQNALAARIVWRRRCQPVIGETVGVAPFGHQLLGLADVARPFRPIERIFYIVVYPVAVDAAEAGTFGLVHRIAIDGETDGLAHALIVKRILRVLETGKCEPPIARHHRRQHNVWI